MPNRAGHTALTLCLVPTALPVIAIGLPEAACYCAGILLTLPFKLGGGWIYLNPDMDIVRNDTALANAFGLTEYQRSISHRSGLRWVDWVYILKRPWKLFWFSHLPFIGTLPRTLLVLAPIMLIALISGAFKHIEPEWALFLWLGMSISDTLHTLADWITHEIRPGRFTKYTIIRGKKNAKGYRW